MSISLCDRVNVSLGEKVRWRLSTSVCAVLVKHPYKGGDFWSSGDAFINPSLGVTLRNEMLLFILLFGHF
jgi:hypothetical protein